MPGELKHSDVGNELSKAEWMAIATHILDSGSPGDLIYWDGVQFKRIPAGAEGEILTSHGAAIPTWETPSSPPVARPNRFVSTSGNVLPDDGLIIIDTTAGPVTLTLPDPTLIVDGHVYGFKKLPETLANNLQLVTILPFGPQNIEGDVSLTFDLPGVEVDIIFDGAHFYITGAL